MKRITILCLSVFFALTCKCQSIVCTPGPSDGSHYLRANFSALDLNDNDDFSSFKMIDTVLSRYQIFFSGEQHYTEGDFEVKWKMLKYLYKNAGVRTLVIEHPPSFGYLLNRFMEKKDSISFIDIAAYAPEGTKERIFYRSLYEFNKNKPLEEQVKVIGIDIDYVKLYSERAFKEMLSDKASNENYVKIKWELNQLSNKILTADSLIGRMRSSDSLYHNFFGKDYPTLVNILKSIACNCEPPGERKMGDPLWTKREELMYANYLSVLAEYPDKKIYAQFGAKHINLNPKSVWYNCVDWSSIASRLNTYDNSPVKNKVCSILLSYSYEWNLKDKRTFYNISPDERFGIFKLNNDSTPFGELAKKIQFLININYGTEDEISYNHSNDIYGLMEDDDYTVVGPVAAFQFLENSVVTVGTEVRSRMMKEKKYRVGVGLNFEFNLKEKMHGYTLNCWFGGAIQAGFAFVYNTNYYRSAFFFRPEIGLARNIFSITYAYNLKLYNKHITEGINGSMLCAKIFLPMSKN